MTVRSLRAALLMTLVFAAAGVGTAYAAPHASMVYPGVDGHLVYVPDAEGNIIPDYSYAGYGGGGVAIPYVPVKAVVWPVEGNDAPAIQAAIDCVSALAPGPGGFRGAVLLKRGYYHLHEPVYIRAGGVVLRGEGSGDVGTVLIGVISDTPKDQRKKFNGMAMVVVDGPERIAELPATTRKVVDEYVPWGARTFRVDSAKGYRPGDTVIVRANTNREWFEALTLTIDNDKWGRGERQWTHDFDRIVTAVEGDRITVDAPLTCPIEARWGGGTIVKYEERRIARVGIENLRGVSEFDDTVRSVNYTNMDRLPFIGGEYYSDENHWSHFIRIQNTINAWVRDVSVLHILFSAVSVETGAKWVTVEDCDSREPVSLGSGSRRFIYHISGQQCLVQRCTSDKGRHSFVMGGRLTAGPNVFLDCEATRPLSTSEPHSDLVTGALYDNVLAPLSLRFAKSNPTRWMARWGVLWNCEGMFICQKPPVGQNYAFGHIGIHAVVFNTDLVDHSFPNGHIESWDEHVSPRSLYLRQLEDRLGPEAVKNIAKPVP